MDLSSCTEDRIHHALQRCLVDLRPDAPNQEFWNAGLCLNRWCLEELLRREERNSLILLQLILTKTEEVLESSQYELVVPLTLLFSSTLLKTAHWVPGGAVLLEAYSLFHSFLSWPQPCSSASKHLLTVIDQELRAPGISFQRLVRQEQGLNTGNHRAKVITVLLAGAGEYAPPDFRTASDWRAVAIRLISQAIRASLGNAYAPHALRAALQTKGAEELQEVLAAVTDSMETAASSADDPETARRGLLQRMDQLAQSLGLARCHAVNGGLTLPFAKCHKCPWEKDNFDNLSTILANEIHHDLAPDLFHESEDDGDGEEEEAEEAERDAAGTNRFSTASSSSRDSMLSCHSLSSSWSVPSRSPRSSGIDSDLAEEVAAETDDGTSPDPSRVRRKPKKKSASLLRVERLSLMFKTPRSPSAGRRVQSMNCPDDVQPAARGDAAAGGGGPPRFKRSQSLPRQVGVPRRSPDPLMDERPVCVRRRPILSCEEAEVGGEAAAAAAAALVRVVVMGGDRELGRLARAYSRLQRTERRSPRLTRRCRLQFFFIPAKTTAAAAAAGGEGPAPSDTQTGSPLKATGAAATSVRTATEVSTNIGHLLALMDPWYQRSVFSLLSLSSQVLYQTTCKADDCVTGSRRSGGRLDRLPLLADLLLYYCRHAHQPALLQLYQAELTLAGGGRVREVFLYSLELGHTAGTRAVRAMGGRSQWTEVGEVACTSINLHKACRRAQLVGTSDWRSHRPLPGRVRPLHPAYCSLLCLPINSFTASNH
ncbi:unnamed protein product [Merluccius merluccius]